MWAFLSEQMRIILFGVHKDGATLAMLLPKDLFGGVLVSDHAAVHRGFTLAQKCWAHLIRKAIRLTLLQPYNMEYRTFLTNLPVNFAAVEKKTLIAAEQEREDVAAKRLQWKQSQQDIDPDRVVFIDETWARTNMTRTCGRSQRGTRVIEGVPFGRWETTTFVGALRSTGFIAPLTVDGPINGHIFLAWVQQHLIPTLQPGDVVVMDNLSSHKVKGVREAIESVGAEVRYLPPYSPDLNPIELPFSKLKKLLRDGAERTVDALWNLCGQILDQFTNEECRNYFHHCGYRYA